MYCTHLLHWGKNYFDRGKESKEHSGFGGLTAIAIAKTITRKRKGIFFLTVKHLSLLFNASNEQDSVLIFHLFFFFLGGLGYVSHTIAYICLGSNPVSCRSKKARRATNLATQLPSLVTHLPISFMTFSSQEKLYCASSFGLVLSQSLVILEEDFCLFLRHNMSVVTHPHMHL
jgi:hypothetical protein